MPSTKQAWSIWSRRSKSSRRYLRRMDTDLDRLARLFPAILADAVDLEVVARGVKVVFPADLFLQLSHFRRKEFNRRSALGANHVMMVAAVELVLVARGAVGKRDGAGQAALRQQLERAIDRGEADLAIALLHQAEEFVRG